MGKMATYEKAVDRLRDELARKHDHPGVQVIGEYLTGRLNADRSLADRLAADGKSIEGAFDAVRDYASKHRNGKGWAYVPPEKALEIACEYYGIPAEKPGTQTPAPQSAYADDGLDLDALLGM